MKGIVKVVAVDASQHESLAEEYEVEGFPTLKIFGEDKESPFDYQGQRTADAIVSEMMEISGRNEHVEFELAPIGLGTAGLGVHTTEIVRDAVLSHGVRLIDTAQAEEWYSEEGVSRGLRAAADGLQTPTAVLVVTKIHPRSFALDKMRERLERSIRLLRDPFRGNSSVQTDLVVLLHSTR